MAATTLESEQALGGPAALMTVVDDNWIETEARGVNRTVWTIICGGKVVYSEEHVGDDPSGANAFEVGLAWAAAHCPGIQFHWRHRSAASAFAPVRRGRDHA